MKRLAIAAVGLALVVLGSGCLYGYVWDAGTNTPRVDAEVTWVYQEPSSFARFYTKKTNSKGFYIFSGRAGDRLPWLGEVLFQVWDSGCFQRVEYRLVAYDDNPIPSYPEDWEERQDFSLSCPLGPEGGSAAPPPPQPPPPQPPPPPIPTPQLIPLPVPLPTPTPTFVALPLPWPIRTPIPPPR